jgi:plastocyanin
MKWRLVTVAAFAVLAAACGSSNNSGTSPSPTTPSNGPAVSIVVGAQVMTTGAYSPNPITVPVGSQVTFTNNDSTSHTATSNSGAFNTGLIQPGGSAKVTFQSAGSFPYHCSIHPNMVGTVTVQ